MPKCTGRLHVYTGSQNSEIALYDINAERLRDSEIILNAINKNVNEGRATIKTYLGVENRSKALREQTL